MSKRKLLKLVVEKLVRGWDDPRLPTLNGLRRKGYTPTAIHNFCDAVGITTNTTVWIDYTVLEHHCRNEMEGRVHRAMAILDPLQIEITNWEPERVEMITRPNHPMQPAMGSNTVPFSRIVYIDRADFAEQDNKNFWGLAPGKEVGLRYAHNITCTDVVRDCNGRIVKILATYDPSHSRKPKGHIHWVAQPRPNEEPQTAEIRLYEPLFLSEKPDELKNWETDINPNSLTIVKALIDESLKRAKIGEAFQFERVGFFVVDADTTETRPVFNRTVSLKESKEKPKL